MATLSSSAEKSGIRIDFRSITDPNVDSGVAGGRELMALAHASTMAEPDPSAARVLADAIGAELAVTAVELAGAFGMVNREMDATGSPVRARKLDVVQQVLVQIGAMEFPNADISVVRRSKTGRRLRKTLHRLSR